MNKFKIILNEYGSLYNTSSTEFHKYKNTINNLKSNYSADTQNASTFNIALIIGDLSILSLINTSNENSVVFNNLASILKSSPSYFIISNIESLIKRREFIKCYDYLIQNEYCFSNSIEKIYFINLKCTILIQLNKINEALDLFSHTILICPDH